VPSPFRPERPNLAPRFRFVRGAERPRGIIWFGVSSFWGHLRHFASVAIATENVDSRDWMTADDPLELKGRVAQVLGSSSPDACLVDALGRDLWLDFVADTGDDVAVSRAVARLIFAEYELPDPDVVGSYVSAPRGEILLFGGDTAYPVATAQEITNRVIVPFNQVLETLPSGPPRVLLGIPGNHDWYDGLDGFARMFRRSPDDEEGVARPSVLGISQRMIERYAEWARQFVRGGTIEKPKALALTGYQPVQAASYFALPLTSRLHMTAVDRQLSNLDSRQVRYFESWRNCSPDVSQLVLLPDPLFAFGAPSRTGTAMVEALNLDLETKPHFLLSGDVHHYERIQHGVALHITAGGGGGFLHGAPMRREQRLMAGAQSRRLLLQVPWKVMRGNSGFLPHIVLAVLFLPAMWVGLNAFQRLGFILSAPILITVVTTLIYSLIGDIRKGGILVFALSFGAGIATATIPIFASVVIVRLAASAHVTLPLWLIATLTFAVAVFYGAFVFGAFLALLTLLGLEETQAFTALDHPGFKHFVRLRVRRDGSAVDFWTLGLTDPLSPDAKPELVDAGSFKLDR
jgi:hypothetical protein